MAIVDFHNHLLPGVDDGAQNLNETHAGLLAFHAEGVRTVVCTPHFEASLTLQLNALRERLSEVDAAWIQLCQHARVNFPDIRLERGVELLLDVPQPDLSDERLRIAGGSYFLMEFPFMTVPPQSARVVGDLRLRGFTPIIAHPERYAGLSGALELAGEWRQAGAYLQVNGGSLLGRYGSEAKRLAVELLSRGWVDYLSSDFHSRGAPLVRDTWNLMVESGVEEQARTLMEVNPTRMLTGMAPLPVLPHKLKEPLWRRIIARFK
jgi:protein-tyrosine phosphatase